MRVCMCVFLCCAWWVLFSNRTPIEGGATVDEKGRVLWDVRRTRDGEAELVRVLGEEALQDGGFAGAAGAGDDDGLQLLLRRRCCVVRGGRLSALGRRTGL